MPEAALDRRSIAQRGKRLEYFTIAWNTLEGLVAVIAGAMAGSISLVGFGLDSFIEVISGATLLWRMPVDADLSRRERNEKLSLRIVGISAPASPARTAGGESQAYDHCQTAADSLLGTDSLCFGGGTDPDPASFPHQTTALDLQRTGAGNPRQRGIPLRPRPTAAPQKAGVHSRPQQRSQPRFERSVQSCRHPG